MPKFSIFAQYTVLKYLGEVETKTLEDAEKASQLFHADGVISLCPCSKDKGISELTFDDLVIEQI